MLVTRAGVLNYDRRGLPPRHDLNHHITDLRRGFLAPFVPLGAAGQAIAERKPSGQSGLGGSAFLGLDVRLSVEEPLAFYAA